MSENEIIDMLYRAAEGLGINVLGRGEGERDFRPSIVDNGETDAGRLYSLVMQIGMVPAIHCFFDFYTPAECTERNLREALITVRRETLATIHKNFGVQND